MLTLVRKYFINQKGVLAQYFVVLLAVIGILTGCDREKYKVTIEPGLTQQEILTKLGEPNFKINSRPDTRAKTWIYHQLALRDLVETPGNNRSKPFVRIQPAAYSPLSGEVDQFERANSASGEYNLTLKLHFDGNNRVRSFDYSVSPNFYHPVGF